MAGLVIDNLDPRIVWYAAGVISLIAVVGFLWLNGKMPVQEDKGEADQAASGPGHEEDSFLEDAAALDVVE
jgi:hypothetical protein